MQEEVRRVNSFVEESLDPIEEILGRFPEGEMPGVGDQRQLRSRNQVVNFAGDGNVEKIVLTVDDECRDADRLNDRCPIVSFAAEA